MFCILAVIILGSAIMCVTTKRIMRAATFLLFVLFGVAGIYFLLDYTFLGAAQISVYAGGITMMYIFAIQLVSKRTLQGLQEHVKGSRVLTGALAALIGFGTVMIVFFKNQLFDHMATMKAMILYIMAGKWSKSIEEYVEWSLKRDIWVKLHFFGKKLEDDLEAENNMALSAK